MDGNREDAVDEEAAPRRGRLVLVGLVVACIALLRVLPAVLEHEEPVEFWDRIPTMDPLVFVVTPWNGALGIFARAAFLVAYPFGEWGPLVTRLLGAAVIGVVAAYLFTRSDAIPDHRVRLTLALALPLLPLPHPGPYDGPLNSHWWIALGVLGVALSTARRWHYPALFLAGFCGLAPCLMWPAFRDRRVVALLIPTAIQAGVLLTSDRRPAGVPVSADYLWIMLALAAALAFARLPTRTRLAFLYGGLAVLAFGAVASSQIDGNWRYLAIPGAGIVLGLAATLRAPHADPELRAVVRVGAQ